MRSAGAKKQTCILTGANAIVRSLGLVLRVWTSRMLGAETMGIIELAQSVHMVAIAPLTSGIPIAMSRLAAKSSVPQEVLVSGLRLVKQVSLILVPLFFISSPIVSSLLGDARVLPSLWFSAPCILILGYSAACNGYCYGTANPMLPAMSEMIEQGLRFLLTILLLSVLSKLTTPWLASVPAAATLIAELAGLLFVFKKIPHIRQKSISKPLYQKQIIVLAMPATLSRLLQTLLRSITSMMIPARLQASGMSAAEATAQLGMLGMISPFLMMPGIFTSALTMVTAPRIAKAEEKPAELKRLLSWCLLGVLPVSLLCSIVLYCLAPVLSTRLYRMPELAPLLRLSIFQLLLTPVAQLIGTTLSALGQQKKLLYSSLAGAIFSLLLTYELAGRNNMRISGVIYAQYASQIFGLISGIALLLIWKRQRKSVKADDRSF